MSFRSYNSKRVNFTKKTQEIFYIGNFIMKKFSNNLDWPQSYRSIELEVIAKNHFWTVNVLILNTDMVGFLELGFGFSEPKNIK